MIDKLKEHIDRIEDLMSDGYDFFEAIEIVWNEIKNK